MRVLVVEDELVIARFVQQGLTEAGYAVDVARDGQDGLEYALAADYDAVVLDILLPRMDGLQLLRELRSRGRRMPVLLLTARNQVDDRVQGLDAGADDYLIKPFNPRELVARVRAILRRTTGSANVNSGDDVRQVGQVAIDPKSREVMVAGKRILLRTKEFDLLLTLADHQNIVLSRDQLLDLVWGYEFYGQTRTVDVHIAHLREKLGDSLKIETVWGMGYKLVSEQ